jgi:hypothetical protein
MKNVVFWDTETEFVLHRRHKLRYKFQPVKAMLRFKVFSAVTMKNVVFWDIKAQFVLHKTHIMRRYRAQPVNAM